MVATVTVSSALSAGWIPFVIVELLVLACSYLFIRCYRHKYDKTFATTTTSFLGLALVFFTCALIPTDVFLVSIMKNSNGTFKEWATDPDTRKSVENGVLYLYYVLFGCIIVFLFLVIPLVYFYWEEAGEDTTTRKKCQTALKNSLVFIIFVVLLLVIGAFAPFANTSPANSTRTALDTAHSTDKNHGSSRGENMFSFVMSVISLLGMVTLILYLGVGLGCYPINLIKGRKNSRSEHEELVDQRFTIHQEIRNLRSKASLGQISSRERCQLDNLEEEEQLLSRKLERLERAEESSQRKCVLLFRPFQLAFGVIFLLMSLLTILSLIMANVDRLMHSPGPRVGYLLVEYQYPVMIDIIFVFSEKLFPLDVVFLFALVFFLLICAIGEMEGVGVWFLCIRVSKFRPHQTRPQALLMASLHLMYLILALNILLHQVAPQYITFGSQHYRANHTLSVNATSDVIVTPCNTEAPRDECTMTQLASILFRYTYKLWFFGAIFYWMSWLFILVFVVSFIVAVVRKKRSSVEEVEYDDLVEEERPLLPHA